MTDIVEELRVVADEYQQSALEKLLERAADEIERLRGALRKYGRHRHTCPEVTGGNLPCSCGFRQELT